MAYDPTDIRNILNKNPIIIPPVIILLKKEKNMLERHAFINIKLK